MPLGPLSSHDVRLMSFDNERVILLALWRGLAAVARGLPAALGRGLALMPGPQSIR